MLPKEIRPWKFCVELAWIFKDACASDESRQALEDVIGYCFNRFRQLGCWIFSSMFVKRVDPSSLRHGLRELFLSQAAQILLEANGRFGRTYLKPGARPMMVVNYMQ